MHYKPQTEHVARTCEHNRTTGSQVVSNRTAPRLAMLRITARKPAGCLLTPFASTSHAQQAFLKSVGPMPLESARPACMRAQAAAPDSEYFVTGNFDDNQAIIPPPAPAGPSTRTWLEATSETTSGAADVQRRIFCNRSLDLSSCRAIGFDMVRSRGVRPLMLLHMWPQVLTKARSALAPIGLVVVLFAVRQVVVQKPSCSRSFVA